MQQIYLIFISLLFLSPILSWEYKSSYHFGYDNNVLKYSESEDILFSKYISTQKSLSRKFQFFERSTKFNLSIKKNYFLDYDDKSNYSLSFKLKQPLGGYRFLDFSYSYINDIYLREYVDVDQGVLDNIYEGTGCDFDFSKYSLGYEKPITNKKSKLNYYYLYQTQFYNPYFTEFDLEINGFKVKYSNKNKLNKYNFSIIFFDAKNITKNDGTISTDYMDRGYTELNYFINYESKLFANKIGLSFNSNSRKYSSNIIQDQLHFNRTHIDYQISVWYSLLHDNKNKSKFLLKYRKRSTSSEYTWVDNLKTFDKIIFEYIIYLKKREF